MKMTKNTSIEFDSDFEMFAFWQELSPNWHNMNIISTTKVNSTKGESHTSEKPPKVY